MKRAPPDSLPSMAGASMRLPARLPWLIMPRWDAWLASGGIRSINGWIWGAFLQHNRLSAWHLPGMSRCGRPRFWLAWTLEVYGGMGFIRFGNVGPLLFLRRGGSSKRPRKNPQVVCKPLGMDVDPPNCATFLILFGGVRAVFFCYTKAFIGYCLSGVAVRA